MKKKKFSTEQLLVGGFAMMILLGGCLLALPFSSRDGHSISFLNALFTAGSASCVTGLVLYDTWTQFSFFGQVIILILIQIGGLGFMTVAIEFSLAARRKIGLLERSRLSEAVGATQIGGVIRLVRRILKGTFIIEGIGAILLSIRFIPKFGLGLGIWFSIFHSVSAFCNAGFDLLGIVSKSSSLTSFSDDPLVCLTIAALIMIGGLGFLVWNDIYEHLKKRMYNRLNRKKYFRISLKHLTLHSQVVIVATVGITVVSTVIFLFLENKNTLQGMPEWQKLVNAFFMAVTPRTAGFNTVDMASMSDSSIFLTMILMFIGASPGGTGGGVKITTVVVAIALVVSSLRGREDTVIRHYRIAFEVQRKAFSTLTLYAGEILLGIFVLCTQGQVLRESLFECLSAIGTVGLTLGITSTLQPISKIAIILLMYTGRVGSMAVFMAFSKKQIKDCVRDPVGGILVG